MLQGLEGIRLVNWHESVNQYMQYNTSLKFAIMVKIRTRVIETYLQFNYENKHSQTTIFPYSI